LIYKPAGTKPLLRCSGFWIDWDEKNKTGTVLTTAHLIRSNRPEFDEWLGKTEYDPNAKVNYKRHIFYSCVIALALFYIYGFHPTSPSFIAQLSNNSVYLAFMHLDLFFWQSLFQVIVHLLDETTAEANLLYYQAHYDIALFRVKVERPVQLPSFNDRVQHAQEVFLLGRDPNLDLRITHSRVEYLNPDVFQRYHFMYYSQDDVNEVLNHIIF
jgi:hypothetical protein